jgi:mannosyltransferase OCH1-like enzyme
MIPKIIHQTAKTKDLSWEERQLIRHNSKLLPGWEIHLWDDADNEKMIGDHFPEYIDKFRSIKRGVMKADIARLVYMHAFGGVYMDTDYKLFKSLNLANQHCVLGLESGSYSHEHNHFSANFKVGNAFFAAERGYPFFTDMVHEIFLRPMNDTPSDYDILTTSGPHSLTRFLQFNIGRYSEITIESPHVFYPDGRAKGLLIKKERSTIGGHLCWGSWRDKRISISIKNKGRRLISSVLS